MHCSESGKYTLVEASVWLWQLACALCALRNASIVHMDIKADNILLMPGKNGIDDLLLADFGVGKDVPAGGASAAGELPPMEQEHISFEMKNLVNNYVHKSLVGRLEGSNVSPATIAEIEGDFAIAMSQYVIDESADMCKFSSLSLVSSRLVSYFRPSLPPLQTCFILQFISYIGSFGVLGLELLDKASSLDYSAMELSQENDICKTIKSKLQKSWEAENQFDQGIFDAICNVVAAALNPRPTKRSTPQKTLEMFELQGM
jgi:serine/threonine protein kinase